MSKGAVTSVSKSPTSHIPQYTGLFLNLVNRCRVGQGVLHAGPHPGLSSSCLCHLGTIQPGVESGHKCGGGHLSRTDPAAAGRGSTVVRGHVARALSLPCMSQRDTSLQEGVQISGLGITSVPAVSMSPGTPSLQISSPSLRVLQPWQK